MMEEGIIELSDSAQINIKGKHKHYIYISKFYQIYVF